MATDEVIEFGSPGNLGDEGYSSFRLALKPRHFLTLALGIQGLSAVFFLGGLWSEILGFRTTPIPYEWQEATEILASLGLIAGFLTTTIFLRRSLQQERALRFQIDVARGKFEKHLKRFVVDWKLSASEEDVTIYAMKGFSNAEIAELRGTSASTVKTQLNAVYRKSGLNNRQQLISFLVEELFSGVAMQ